MNKRWLLTIAAAAVLLTPAGQAPAYPAATAAPASSAAPAAAPGEGTSLEAAPPGAEVSKAPTAEEWKTASRVKLARNAPACSVYLVREWLKIHCSGFPGAGVSLLAGSRDGVQVWVDPSGGEGPDSMTKPRDAEIILPLRRGDGRLFQIAQFGEGYDGPIGWNNAFSVSECWIEGEAAPIVTVR
jgi:hypothetical protein